MTGEILESKSEGTSAEMKPSRETSKTSAAKSSSALHIRIRRPAKKMLNFEAGKRECVERGKNRRIIERNLSVHADLPRLNLRKAELANLHHGECMLVLS